MATISDEPYVERSGGMLRRILLMLAFLVAVVAIYFIGGAFWVHTIDDDPAFGTQTAVPEGASRAVAAAADLIDREVNEHRWVANDPPFLPGSLLDNMPAYQNGIMTALGRFTVELRDRVARARGSSAVDVDLEGAAGRINYPGDVWIFEWSGTPVQPSSESQYRRGMDDLRRYNQRLAQGQAVFERRADNLMWTIDRISDDLGGSMAALSQETDLHATNFLDFNADNLFYNVKGKLYAYYIIMRELEHDYANVIRERNLHLIWDELLQSLRPGAVLHPWVVTNGPMDSQAVPNHLAAQGFLLLRARTKLEEIVDILQT
jgi:hypothetical protein